jgi:signal transduction histidine kinase
MAVSRMKGLRFTTFWSFFVSFILAFAASNLVSFSIYYFFSSPPDIFAYTSLGVFVISFTLFFYKSTHRMINYTITLADGLQIISEGNLDYRIPVIRKDELGQVALNINVMTERLQLEMEKERTIEKSKMELITGVSHDLRTPLTSIIGYLELLKTDSFQDKAEYTRFVQNSYNRAIHLKKLIDDLFEYTRLTTPDAKLHLKTISVHQLLEQMLFEFEPFAQENQIHMINSIGELPVLASVDSSKFARAIDNLLMNALKYSHKPGSIHVTMRSDDQRLYIEVKNSGQPLTQEQEERLFERFYKVDDSRSSDGIQAGSGLGLSIAKNIIELHGGTLKLNHTDGVFIFTIAVPLAGLE